MATFYSFSPVTGEYTGSGEPDIVEGDEIYPAHVTLVAPPAGNAGHAVVWDGSNWTNVPDFRGAQVWTPEGQALLVTGLGDPELDGLLLAPPEQPEQSKKLDPAKPDDAELVPDPEPPEDEALPPEPEPDPEPTLDQLKHYAKVTVIAFADEMTEQVKNAPNGGIPYPAGEQAKWTQKEAEARAYKAVTDASGTIVEADYPYLWKLSGQDSATLATLVTAVLFHADRFEDAAVIIEQLRTQTFTAIESCADQGQINAVLEDAKATALAGVTELLANV